MMGWARAQDLLADDVTFRSEGKALPQYPHTIIPFPLAKTATPARCFETFFAGPFEWVDFDGDDARTAGAIRAELEAAGRPVGAYDLFLAGQARRRGATLVTSNTKELGRVPGLKWEDWAAPRR